MDPGSLAVFTTLGINMLGTLIILLSWLYLRKHRGDRNEAKKDIATSPDRHRKSRILYTD